MIRKKSKKEKEIEAIVIFLKNELATK